MLKKTLAALALGTALLTAGQAMAADYTIDKEGQHAFIDWKDNADILDDAPSVYYPVVCEGRSEEDILRMEEENALPHGWEYMDYEEFLVERRKLMSAKIKTAYEKLKGNV